MEEVKTCSNDLAVGRQSCEVEKEMAAIIEYHMWSKGLVTFLLCINWSILQKDSKEEIGLQTRAVLVACGKNGIFPYRREPVIIIVALILKCIPKLFSVTFQQSGKWI